VSTFPLTWPDASVPLIVASLALAFPAFLPPDHEEDRT
jgi:hypothetical protein